MFEKNEIKNIIVKNFVAGIFKGIGISVGVTVFSAVLIIFLQRIVSLNIPIIGEYVTDIVEIVEKSK